MSTLVYFEVLGPCKYLATANKRTSERLLTRVDSYVVDKLVFGLEWLALTDTVVPEADVDVLLGAAHMINGQMGHDLVHAVKDPATHGLCVRVDPTAHILGARSCVAQESARVVVSLTATARIERLLIRPRIIAHFTCTARLVGLARVGK